MKIRRDVLLVIGIPLIFVLSLQFILALTIPQEQLEEKLTIYDIDYQPSTFKITNVEVKYNSGDELQTDFIITGGNGQNDLFFRVYCQDINHSRLLSAGSGTVQLFSIGASYSNSTVIGSGDFIGGSLVWPDVPSGSQKIRLYVILDNIYLDTWTFYAELRDE
jgi:hypothetical protein